jgi:hypothetical protein
MCKRLIILISIIMVVFSSLLFSQENPLIYQKWNIMDINRVRTQFNNTGELCDGNQENIPLARPPAFEYPNGSGVSYGTCIGIMIGAPADQDTAAVGGEYSSTLPYCDGTINEGPAGGFWDPEHFAPYPEVVGSDKAALSTDKSTWPKQGVNQGWPALIPGTNKTLNVGSEGWPGLGPNGERLADQETYSVMYSWRGRKENGTQEARRWLRTNLEMWGLAWTGELYQDFIIWVYVVHNRSTAPIKDMRIGIYSDFGYIPVFLTPDHGGDPNRYYYYPKYQLAWGMADNPLTVPNPFGPGILADVGVSGTMALRMPGSSKSVETYSAFHWWQNEGQPGGTGGKLSLVYKYDLLNLDNPRSSKNDGFCDDFDMDGIPDTLNGGPNYFYATGSDGLQTMGSGPFTLQPGQSDTLIFATVFGKNKDELFKHALSAYTLYHSGWKIVKAPTAPALEIVPGNGQNTLYWNIKSEQTGSFEGYKIYRSADNGATWGTTTVTDFDGGIHYLPLAQYDKIDSIEGHYTSIPNFAWYYLGNESGFPPVQVINNDSLKYFKQGDSVRVFVDNTVTNGLKYRYYIAAYDTGHGITGPLENTAASVPGFGTNTIEVIPQGSLSTVNLSQVKVVPNPYIVASGWEQGTNHELQFIHLPMTATIKIFNTAGELVRTIQHDGNGSMAPSIEMWDLKNENQQLAAPGLYFFYVSSTIGSTQGKFVIIL